MGRLWLPNKPLVTSLNANHDSVSDSNGSHSQSVPSINFETSDPRKTSSLTLTSNICLNKWSNKQNNNIWNNKIWKSKNKWNNKNK